MDIEGIYKLFISIVCSAMGVGASKNDLFHVHFEESFT